MSKPNHCFVAFPDAGNRQRFDLRRVRVEGPVCNAFASLEVVFGRFHRSVGAAREADVYRSTAYLERRSVVVRHCLEEADTICAQSYAPSANAIDSCGVGHRTLAGTQRPTAAHLPLCVYRHRQTGPAALRVVSTVRLLHFTDVVPCPSLHLICDGTPELSSHCPVSSAPL